MPSREQQISAVLDQDHFATTGRGIVRLLLFGFGIMLVFVAVRLSFDGGWTGGSFDGPFAPLLPIIALGLALVYGGWMMWTRGRLRAAVVLGAAAAVVIAGGITLVSRLPGDVFPGLAPWMMALAGVLAIVVAAFMGEGAARGLDDEGIDDPDARSARIRHLLIGRYGFPPALAASATAELPAAPVGQTAPSNADSLAAHPEVVAAQVAARTPEAAARASLFNRLAWVVVVALWLGLIAVPQVLAGGLAGQVALALGLGVLVLAWSLWRLLPARRAADAATLLERRRARARRIALVVDPHA